jgi:uncharacterized protein (DUF4415 family)
VNAARKEGHGEFLRFLTRCGARPTDGKIDLTDAPEIREWRGAVIGKFYRPIKKPVTLRGDADVLAWWKRQGRGYQTRINALLRAAMEGPKRRRG